jgi:hypothetical protein
VSATITTLSNILKRHYLGPVREQLNNSILVMQLFDVTSENLEGLQVELPLHTARSGGIGSRGELETLPSAGNQGYSKAVYDLAYHYGRVQVSGQAIHKTRSSVGAFLRAMKSELDYIKDDLALDFARQVYGAGDGVVAALQAGTSVNTLTLVDNEALVRGFLYVGMKVDIGTTGSPQTIAAGRTITDVDVTAGTITIDGAAVTVTTSHRVFRAGNLTSAGVVREMDAGLQKIISTSANSVGGINAASAGSRFWDNLRDTSGGAISLSNLMINLNKVLNAGVQLDNLAVTTTPGILRRLFESADFASKIQFVNTDEMKGGFESVSFATGAGRVRMSPDRLHPRGKVLFVPKRHIKLFSPGDWDFLAKDGQAVKWVQDKDAFQSVLYRYANMGTDRRNNALIMSGLTDTDF